MVLSSEWPSTKITSKFLKFWLTRSWSNGGKSLSSFKAGMIMEKNGFGFMVLVELSHETDCGVR